MAHLIDKLLARVLPAPELVRAATDATAGYEANVTPPARGDGGPVTPSQAVTVPMVYRALQLFTTAAGQLSVDSWRGRDLLPSEQQPAVVRRPDLDVSQATFIKQAVMSMAVSGNLFCHKQRAEARGPVVAVKLWNPHTVGIGTEKGRTVYYHDGKKYDQDEVVHRRFLELPGQLRGLGPIQAAQATLRGHLDRRDYSAHWFDDSGQPTGILSSDQALSGDDAQLYRNAWNGLDAEGNALPQAANPSGVKVLGKGLTYQPILLSPTDALWLEAQAFDTIEVARLFGITSPSLILAAPEGGTETYKNIEQDWLAFVRFTLMGYLQPVEDALTELSPRGQTVRFNLDGLLRPDTTTRYAAHKSAVDAGWMDVDEVRAIEGLPPLTAAQRERMTAKPKPAPATQEAPA